MAILTQDSAEEKQHKSPLTRVILVGTRTPGQALLLPEGISDHFYKTDVTTKAWRILRSSIWFCPYSPHVGRPGDQLISVA